MELARDGDQQAFAQLYEQFAVPLFRYIFFRVNRKEDAEDILQSVFLKAYRSLPRFRDLGKEPLSYFYTIARTTVIDFQRKKHEVPIDDSEHALEHIPDESMDTAHLASLHSEGAKIREGMSLLSEEQQEVITLRFMQDLSHKEIAKVMNKSEVAVRQLQSRGLRILREKLVTKLS